MRSLIKVARKKARERADRARGDESNALMPLFADLCVALDVGAVFELGAHAAEFSILMHGRIPHATVVALEANPFVFERYRERMPPGVRYLNKAAGADALPKQFHVVKSLAASDGMHSQERTNPFSGLMVRGAGEAQYETVTTDCTTVDLLHAEHGDPRSALWIDVEGANETVLRGAAISLADAVQCILIEVEEKTYWEGQWLAADVRILPCRDRLRCRRQGPQVQAPVQPHLREARSACRARVATGVGLSEDRTRIASLRRRAAGAGSAPSMPIDNGRWRRRITRGGPEPISPAARTRRDRQALRLR